MIFDWILENKEILKIIYALIICFICAIIVIESNRLFKLSDVQGLRYFRNSFFFYGLAFFLRYILGKLFNTIFLFEFFIITAGLFLLYSFTWKYAEYMGKFYYSFLNPRAGSFYIIAILIAWVDSLLSTPLFMYVFQILLFTIMSFISYDKYVSGGRKNKASKYYFVVILLGLLMWILNMFLEYFINWNVVLQIIVYSINILFFAFFFYVIIKITKGKNG